MGNEYYVILNVITVIINASMMIIKSLTKDERVLGKESLIDVYTFSAELASIQDDFIDIEFFFVYPIHYEVMPVIYKLEMVFLLLISTSLIT